MALIEPALGAKLVFILGITNLIGILLVLLSCRCILGFNPEKLGKNKLFMAVYKHHCWYWRFFILSVFLHAVLAIYLYGVPF